MSYSYGLLSDLLNDPIFLEGDWLDGEYPCKEDICSFCKNKDGYRYIPCIVCHTNISQCKLITLHGVCRVREDHNCGYPVAYACRNCYTTTIQPILIERKINNLTINK
jgi:hypothetical protein